MTELRKADMTDLKPCPFCGSLPRIDEHVSGTAIWFVITCNPGCGLMLEGRHEYAGALHATSTARAKAIEVWNRRPPTAAEAGVAASPEVKALCEIHGLLLAARNDGVGFIDARGHAWDWAEAILNAATKLGRLERHTALASPPIETEAPPPMNSVTEGVARPIIGIENRTAQEVFDIMCDRIKSARRSASTQAPVAWTNAYWLAEVQANGRQMIEAAPVHSGTFDVPLYASPVDDQGVREGEK